MNGVDGLERAVRRVANSHKGMGQAQRGIIQGDKVCIGNRAYPFTAAVECHTEPGSAVWVQLTKTGRAVIVGA